MTTDTHTRTHTHKRAAYLHGVDDSVDPSFADGSLVTSPEVQGSGSVGFLSHKHGTPMTKLILSSLRRNTICHSSKQSHTGGRKTLTEEQPENSPYIELRGSHNYRNWKHAGGNN